MSRRAIVSESSRLVTRTRHVGAGQPVEQNREERHNHAEDQSSHGYLPGIRLQGHGMATVVPVDTDRVRERNVPESGSCGIPGAARCCKVYRPFLLVLTG